MLITMDNKFPKFNNLKNNFRSKNLLDFSTVHYYYLIQF